jgi:hypothetical protein
MKFPTGIFRFLRSLSRGCDILVDKRTRAFRRSIDKWDAIIAGDALDPGYEVKCALCTEYYFGTGTSGCRFCPLARDGYSYAHGPGYYTCYHIDAWKNMTTAFRLGHRRAFIKAAKEFRAWLLEMYEQGEGV